MVALANDTPATLATAGLMAALPALCERFDTRAFPLVQNRDEAEALLVRDRSMAPTDTEWTAFLVESMVEFLVWQNPPAGRLTPSDLDWLVGLIGDRPSPSVPALLFALVRELNEAPERLVALAMRHARNRLMHVS